jgi:hypothetical protein
MPTRSNEEIFPNLRSLPDFTRPVSASIFTPIVLTAASSNGEVEGPHGSAGQATRAHNLFPRPRRQTDHASRTPPTIVRRRSVHVTKVPPHATQNIATAVTATRAIGFNETAARTAMVAAPTARE